MMFLTHLLRLPTLLWFLAVPGSALAQSHEQVAGPYVLRATVSTTAAIAEESAQAHGIEQKADRAILNVIVLNRDDPRQIPQPARVSAQITDLAGVLQEVELRRIEANNRISYTGTFQFLPREVVEFRISAQPEGSTETIDLQFRERLWRDRP